MSEAITDLAQRVNAALAARGWVLATAESCTGGLIAGAVTDIPGSSRVFDRGFVTYSNAAKTALVSVHPDILAAHGAVSRETAIAMAEGAITASAADIAVSVTGVAGPDGGSAEKPVGLVHIGLAFRRGQSDARVLRFGAIDRRAVRGKAVEAALSLVLEQVQTDE